MSKEESQGSLFPDMENEWEKEWHGMPEFEKNDESAFKQIIVSFRSYEDMRKFGELLNQKVTPKTKSLWYPKAEIERYMDKRWKSDLSNKEEE